MEYLLCGNILSDGIARNEKLLMNMGNILAITSNDEVNALAIMGTRNYSESTGTNWLHIMGQCQKNYRGHIAFGETATYNHLESLFSSGVKVESMDIGSAGPE
jgi:hypothetical protein